MFGGLTWYYSFLLQDRVKYFKDDNPEEVRIVLIGLAGVFVLAMIIRFIMHGAGGSFGGKKSAMAQRNFTAFTLFRISSAYGLTRDQSKLLEFVFRNASVSDPERVMKNPGSLDRHFRKAYIFIEKNSTSDEETQQRLANLYALRNTIEASPGSAESSGTPELKENTPAILQYANENHQVKIIMSQGVNIITDVPKNALGTPMKFPKDAKVVLSVFTKGNKGYSIDGQVASSGNTSKGPGIKIVHSGKMKPLAKRLSRRKQVTMKCEILLVRIEESGSGRKITKKLVEDKHKFSGAIQDISIGGCAIKTNAPIQAGSRIKISFNYSETYTVSVIGQVLRTNKSGFSGIILHIKFLKVPRRAYNCINTLVFGFDKE